MLRILLILFILWGTSRVNSQLSPLNSLLRPEKTSQMPDWAEGLYNEPINLLKIDQAYKDYYIQHPFKKNHWTRYYKRLIRSYNSEISNDGLIKSWNSEEWDYYRQRKESNHLTSVYQRSSAADWKDIGPYSTQWLKATSDTFCPWQANIYSFEISKSNPNVLYCITETGSLFRSNDKGNNWNLKGQNYVLNSEALAIHPTNENILLIGVNSAIRKSADGGNNFTTVFTNNNMGITNILYNSSQPNIVFAATSTGLWRSSNGGDNWNRILNDQCLEIEFHPTNNNIVYVLKKNNPLNFYEVWKSINGGLTFRAKVSGWPTGLTNGVGRLAVCPQSPNKLYAVLLTNDKPRMVISDDQAETWTITAKGETAEFPMDNWQGFYDLDLMVNHTNSNEIIVGTASCFKSSDGGYTFENVGGYGGKFPLHPDLQVCRCNGSDSYICTDGGITYSNDFFTNHATYRSFGITSTDMWGFGSGWNEDILVGGRYHNGNTVWHENYGPQIFLRMGGAESPTGYVNSVNNKQVYFSDIGSYEMGEGKFDNAISKPFSLWPNESYYTMEFSEIEFHPEYYNTLFIGKDSSIYKSENNGVSFNKLFSIPERGAEVQHIEISRENSDLIFFTSRNNSLNNGKIWKSTDGGLSFIETTPLPVSASQRRVMQISLSEKNILYVALRSGNNGNKVFKSEDLGMSWSNLSTSELNDLSIESIVCQLSSPNEIVYISTSSGKIFYRDKSAKSWELYNSNLPVNHSSRQLRPFYRDNKLRTGSNIGFWETSLVEKSLPYAQASVDKKTSSCSRDTFYFDSYSVLEYDGQERFEWNFPEASYVSNKFSRNPKVVFGKEGIFDVELKTTNGSGSSHRNFSKMIHIEKSECDIQLIPGKSISMNGTRKVISIPKNSRLKDAKGITLMCWIKINEKQQWFTQIISNWGSVSNLGFGFAFQGYVPTTNLTFSWKDVPYQLTTSHEVPINQWTHVALTVDSNKAVVYMNGKAWTRNQKFTIDIDKTPFELGNGVPGQGGTFNGQMDELKIYKRALSQNEIREQMHLINSATDSDMVLYYQFNEEDQNTIYDKIGVAHGLNGASPLVKSTIAAGPGTSDRIGILSNKVFKLQNTNSSLDFGTGQIPNGEIVLSRIKYSPDTLGFSFNRIAGEYFVFRNWGSNSTFNGLKSILIDSSEISTIGSKLYFRNSANAEGNTWNPIALPGESQAGKSDGNTKFINQNYINSESQWIVAGDRLITQNIELNEDIWKVFPNPVLDEIIVQHLLSDEGQIRYVILDITGKQITEGKLTNVTNIKFNNFSRGNYILQIYNSNRLEGSIAIEKL